MGSVPSRDFVDTEQEIKIEKIETESKEEEISEYGERNILPRQAPVTYRVPHMSGYNDGINGWDTSANETINNWFETCREYRWRYQFILDRNYRLAAQLNGASITFSSVLSIFSGFKLWKNEQTFQNVSNIVMLISNTLIAGITTLSKKYIDDSRNEKIKNFVECMDKFLGVIHSQVIVSPIYRVDSFLFIQQNISEYTSLMTNCPNLTTREYTLAKKSYGIFLQKLKKK